MNPCKICIVRACCTQECKAYRVFRELASSILVFISLFLSLVFAGSLVCYLLEFYPNKEHAKEILQWVWTGCLIFNISFSKFNLEKGKKGSIIFEVLCGPFCTAIYTFMFIGAKIFRRM
jgi:hypothetical protein